MLRLYFDEDMMDQAVVDGLRMSGIILTTVTEAGMRGRTDAELDAEQAEYDRLAKEDRRAKAAR